MMRKAALTPMAAISHQGCPGASDEPADRIRPGLAPQHDLGDHHRQSHQQGGDDIDQQKTGATVLTGQIGNFQILPSPTADPRVAASTPKVLVNPSLALVMDWLIVVSLCGSPPELKGSECSVD
jgi:hypothetical protein